MSYPRDERKRRTIRGHDPHAPTVRQTVKFTPPCRRCRYPLLPGETSCPRCVREGRA